MGQNRYQRHIRHNSSQFSLVIIRSRRKTLAIHVLPDAIEVRVPLKCPWIEIDDFIESRLDWLVSAQEQMQSVPAPPKFVSGESHEFRGQLFTLNVTRASSNWVWTEGNKIEMHSKQPDEEGYNEQLFHQFVKREAEQLFPKRLEYCVRQFPLEVEPSGLRIRRMKARWGSCSEGGEICLNSMLAQKDVQALDLVITHELCHLEHFHHDKAFYRLMDRAMPDWREREQLLKTPEGCPDVQAGQQFSLF